LLFRVLQATCPVETEAQDRVPTPVAELVEVKLPEDHGGGAISKQTATIRFAAIFLIVSLLTLLLRFGTWL
jgi:hypothetical protein